MSKVGLLLAWLGLSAGSARAEAPSFEGRPIAAIEFIAEPTEDLALLRSLLDIEPGYLFATSDVSRAVKRLFALGRFADARAHARDLGGAVVLTFSLEPQAVLGELILRGDDDDQVLQDLRLLLSPKQPVDDYTSELVERRCRKAWALEGHHKAVCRVRLKHRARSTDVIVDMSAGPPTLVRDVTFAGRPRVDPTVLLRELKLKPGERYVERRLKEDERALRTAYYRRGFLTASVRSEALLLAEQGEVAIRYTLDAGERVSLKVSGNSRFKDSELLAELGRTPDERLTSGLLEDWRRRVLVKYRLGGLATAQARLESYRETPRNLVHHVLRILEGPTVTIRELRFPGAEFFDHELLRGETHAVVAQQLDVPLVTNEVDPADTRALLDGEVGLAKPAPLRAPDITHPVLRHDPSKLYDEDLYGQAEEAIRRMYLAQGFTQIEVGPSRLEVDASGHVAVVIMPVQEGPRTLVTSVDFLGSEALRTKQLEALSRLRRGDPYAELTLEETRLAIEKALGNLGYVYARIEVGVDMTKDRTGAAVRFEIGEGPQVIVSRVLLQGNDETKESVIRERVALKPDQPYSPESAQATRDGLNELEVFDSSTVGLADPDVPSERKDVLVRVLERKTSSIELSLGVSTGQGVRGFVEFSERNLAGRAILLAARLQLNRQFLFYAPDLGDVFYGGFAENLIDRYAHFRELTEAIERLARLSVRTPRYLSLPGKPLFYAEAMNERRNARNFSLDAVSLLGGLDVLLARPLGFVFENSLVYNHVHCFDERTGQENAGSEVSCLVNTRGPPRREQAGRFFFDKVGPALVLDLRDDRANPRAGLLTALRSDAIAGVQLDTGKGFAFVKLEGRVTGYIPVFKRASFAVSLRGGNIFPIFGEQQVVRLLRNERYQMGGQDTLRGHSEGSVIPQDACLAREDEPAERCADPDNRVAVLPVENQLDEYRPPDSPGGAFFVLTKGEFRFPVVGDVFGSVFIDAGNLYFSATKYQPLNLRVNIGAGVRFKTQVGSIAIDVGINPAPRGLLGEPLVQIPFFYFGIF